CTHSINVLLTKPHLTHNVPDTSEVGLAFTREAAWKRGRTAIVMTGLVGSDQCDAFKFQGHVADQPPLDGNVSYATVTPCECINRVIRPIKLIMNIRKERPMVGEHGFCPFA